MELGVNGIGTTGYPAWQGARKTQQNTAGKNFAEQVNNASVTRNVSLVEMTALESYMGADKNGGLTSLPPGTGMMGLNDRIYFMDMFQKQISDMKLLSQKKAAAYYQYSMQAYWDFMNRK